jgi:anti-sigma B factor antagonist
MEITQTQQGGILVMAVKGRLDAHTSKEFETRLIAPIDQGAKQIIVDFAEMDYISSAGLRVLLLAARKLSDGDGKIALCGLKPAIKTVFDIAGFSNIFPIYASLPEARNNLMK